MQYRIIKAVIIGFGLGILCIIGAQLRSGSTLTNSYLFSLWYNRILLGFVIGLINYRLSLKYAILRGAIVGLIVSFAFYSATGYDDLVGFIAGAVYGMIIEYILFKKN